MPQTILIIEDDSDTLHIMTYILQQAGFAVVGSTASVSVAYIQALNPALILLDHRLADGLGCDLCLVLKKNPLTRHLPVVLISAVNKLAALANQSGADAYLSKPFDVDDLIAITRRFA